MGYVLALMGIVTLFWRHISADRFQYNITTIQLLHALHSSDNDPLAQVFAPDELTSVQGRVLASLRPAEQATWLGAGNETDSFILNLFELCRHFWQQGDTEEAVATCQSGDIPAAYWIRIGLVAEQSTEWETALSAYEMAVSIEPDSSNAWFRLGHTRFVLEDYPGVISALKSALAHGYAGGSNVHEELGRAYVELGDLVAAEKTFNAGLEQYPDARPLFYDMVDLARQKQDWAQADAWLARLSANWPEETRPWLLRGEIALQQGNAADTLDYYQKATNLEPDNPSAWAGVGQAAARLNDRPTATAAFLQLMALEPANPGFWVQAGEFFYQQEVWEEARIAFNRTLELDPNNQQAQTRLAEIEANE